MSRAIDPSTEKREEWSHTRRGPAQAVNSALVLLYWQIGRRIRTEVLHAKRAAYGEEICSTLSNELAAEFGNVFTRPNLTRLIRFPTTTRLCYTPTRMQLDGERRLCN